MTDVVPMIDEGRLGTRVEALAREIAAAVPPDVVLVVLLKGSFVFAADLLRALGRHGAMPQVAFMRLASYGLGTTSSGEVRLIGEVPDSVADRPVLVVDDIQDTGRTLLAARELLLEKGAARVWSCVLLDKPSRREVDFAADFVGFEIEDVFVVGYGIDHAERHRQLPYIGRIEA
jgi:hypoxanthine phosphoribosyltransferase